MKMLDNIEWSRRANKYLKICKWAEKRYSDKTKYRAIEDLAGEKYLGLTPFNLNNRSHTDEQCNQNS